MMISQITRSQGSSMKAHWIIPKLISRNGPIKNNDSSLKISNKKTKEIIQYKKPKDIIIILTCKQYKQHRLDLHYLGNP
jgi:hypothetical protein